MPVTFSGLLVSFGAQKCLRMEPCGLLLTCRFKDQTRIKNGDQYVIHENGTLEILVAQPLNSGKYTCIATNNLGMKENHVYLEVKGQTGRLVVLKVT